MLKSSVPIREPLAPTLNVGLARNDGGPNLLPEDVLHVLRWQLGRHVSDWTVAMSDTEPTLIAAIDAKLSEADGNLLAERLYQDAIAQFDGFNGQLYGPNAEAWRPFNPAYFLGFDGRPVVAPEPERKAA